MIFLSDFSSPEMGDVKVAAKRISDVSTARRYESRWSMRSNISSQSGRRKAEENFANGEKNISKRFSIHQKNKRTPLWRPLK